MTTRLNPYKAAPDVFKAMMDLQARTDACGLEPSLLELVKMRASQINDCAFCLHMHAKDARAAGESEERLYLLDAWRESPLYSARERAALAWTECLTLITQTRAPDVDYEEARRHFSEEELAKLSLAIVTINGWNRLNAGFHVPHPVSVPAHRQAG